MKMLNRRTLVKAMTAAGVGASALGLQACSTQNVRKTSGKKVVVIGGGFGGATVAKYIKRYDSSVEVTLLEPKKTYMTCPGSNWYLAGLVDVDYLTHDYESLKTEHNVNVIHKMASSVDKAKQEITLDDGQVIAYDRLVVSPGIDFKWDAIEGYSEEASEILPHAWKAGPQTELLYKQIREMPQGGTFLMVAPPNKFRCGPGPYERLSMVADYFKRNNPTASIICLDPKKKFSKQSLFMDGWRNLYGQMIEWWGAVDGATVTKIDVANKTVYSEFDTITADVINVIPAQKAGKIAFDMGLTNESGWCPVNQSTFESTVHKGIYVVGDSCIAGAMPKSGHSASVQGKHCAAAVVSDLNGLTMPAARTVNTCYSLVGADYGISVVGIYEPVDGVLKGIKGAGGVSRGAASAKERKQEAQYAMSWYQSITTDIWRS